MKKYQLTGQPIYVGETYNHNGDLYRVCLLYTSRCV